MNSRRLGSPQSRFFWIALCGTLLASRLAHRSILWADEDYHLAEAIQVLAGKVLYLDVWYDKPPLSALLLALFGAPTGGPLRVLGAVLSVATCIAGYRFARKVWGPREGYFAAGLLGFYQVFYFAHATIPLEPDTFMVLPHLLAVYWAWSGRPVAAGVAAGFAFLLNLKGLFVLAAAAMLCPIGISLAGWGGLLIGFAVPVAAGAGWLTAEGALPSYIEQVWRWGLLYAGSPPNDSVWSPLGRLGNWLAFHSALVMGVAAGWTQWKTNWKWKWAAWAGLSLLATCVGWRISPHYLNQLLPPLTIGAAGGLAWLSRKVLSRPHSSETGPLLACGATAAVIVALMVPVIRFGPRYAMLAAEDVAGKQHSWSDVQMDQDSQKAAQLVRKLSGPGDTVFVWGYRPNIVAYTRLQVAGRLWDSQPVTGVAADRHLGNAIPLDPEWARRNRAQLTTSHPDFIVDGLSAYNPELDLHKFADLAEWFKDYCPVAATGRGITIYKKCVGQTPR